MSKKKTRVNFEIIILGIATLLLGLAGIKFPTFLMITTLLSIIPIVLITVKYKEGVASVACLGILAITFLIFPVPQVLLQTVTYCIVGVSIGYCLRNKFSLGQTIAVGAVAYVLVFVLIHFINLYFWKVNIIESLFINNVVNVLEEGSASINQIKIDNISVKKLADEFNNDISGAFYTIFEVLGLIIFVGRSEIKFLFYVIPGYIILLSLIFAYFTIIISSIAAKRFKYENNNCEPLSKFRLPDGFGLIFIIVQLFLWGTLEQDSLDKSQQVLLNIGLILNFSLMAQGIAFMDFWITKIGINGLLKTIIYIVGSIMLFPFVIILSMILMIAGMLDYVMDIRKLETK